MGVWRVSVFWVMDNSFGLWSWYLSAVVPVCMEYREQSLAKKKRGLHSAEARGIISRLLQTVRVDQTPQPSYEKGRQERKEQTSLRHWIQIWDLGSVLGFTISSV